PPANELGSRQAAPRKSSAHLVRGPAACRDCPAGRKQCQPSSCSNDRLVKKHSGLEASLRLEQYLRRQALTTWAAASGERARLACWFRRRAETIFLQARYFLRGKSP